MSTSRLADAASQVPLCTLSVTILCVSVHVCVLIFQPRVENFTLSAAYVIYLGEYYRIVTSALLHVGMLHIGFNMMSFMGIGAGLERAIGTLGLAFIILWSMILSGTIAVIIEWMLTAWLMHDMKYILQMSVGFSGVIFTLALMECHSSPHPTRSVFGFFPVPTKLYPWVLLVLLSVARDVLCQINLWDLSGVILPHISFTGHLSGILVGLLHVYGLTKSLLPSPAYLAEIESWSFVQERIGQRPNFIRCPGQSLSTNEEPHIFSGRVREFLQRLRLMAASVTRLLAVSLQSASDRVRNGDSRRGNSAPSEGDTEASARISRPLP